MSQVRPAADANPAQWVTDARVAWSDLVRYGPPGFAAYVRVAFDEDDGGAASEQDRVRRVLAVLATCTGTPDRGCAAIWEGWTGGSPPSPAAPRVEIPHRAMLLFCGPVAALRDAPSLAWGVEGDRTAPHLVWPEDHAWCLACEVDEEVEFSVGCPAEAADALAAALPGAVRRVRYGEPAPLYRDEAGS